MTDKVIIDGVEYNKNDRYIVQDYFTGDYFHYKNSGGIHIITDFDILTDPKVEYNPEEPSTRMLLSARGGYTTADNYDRAVGGKFGPVTMFTAMVAAYNGKVDIISKEPMQYFIDRFDLVPGVHNPEIYFRKLEIKVMDRPKPYRKFDNTYFKRDLNYFRVGAKPLTATELRHTEVKELLDELKKVNYEYGTDSPTNLELEGIRVTLGHEIETATGILSEEDVEGLNVKAVHDGSLRGPNGENPLGGEYVTGVLYGDNGFLQLQKICKKLSERCTIDKRCGNHVHIGSLNWNREDIVYSYLLGEMVEAEMYSMLPLSRRKSSYCRPITRLMSGRVNELMKAKKSGETEYKMLIDELFTLIFQEVAGSASYIPSRSYNRENNHPKGSKCGWDKSSQRYCWLNYVTLLFNTKGVKNSHTLEIRSHGASLNFKKVKNWAKIWVAFVNMVNNHKEAILTGTYVDKKGAKYKVGLELIVKLAYPKRGNALIDYIRERKEVFKTADESIDYVEKTLETTKSIKEIICA